jgi:tryptophan halogenase
VTVPGQSAAENSMIRSRPDCQHIKKVVVLGGGSAGLLVALSLARRLPELETLVVRSTKMGVIGVGEGSIAFVTRFIHRFLNIDPQRFHQEVHPGIKLGVKFLWGRRPLFHYTFTPQFTGPNPPGHGLRLPRGFYCRDDASCADVVSALMHCGKAALRTKTGQPRLTPSFAYHLENRRFVNFLEKLTSESGVRKIDAVVNHVETGPRGVEYLQLDTGEQVTADLFVDCSGFGSALLGTALAEPFVDFSDALFCDRAVVGGWPRSHEPYLPYTTAETMNAGWSWQIEHDDVINRGYVYSSSFISDEDADREFRNANPQVTETRKLDFRCGVYRRAWVKNVVAIGNAYGFVEPLEATAISMICTACGYLVQLLHSGECCVEQVQRQMFNRRQERNWESIRDFLAIHYKFNERIDSPFWRACQNDVSLGKAQEIVDYYQSVGPDFAALETDLRSDIFGTEGYVALLLGQQVPFRRCVAVPNGEQDNWNRVRHLLMASADSGFDMQGLLDGLRSGQFRLPRLAHAGDAASGGEPFLELVG